MLWVLKRIVSMRRFFWAPKTFVRLLGKKIIAFLCAKILLNWTYNGCMILQVWIVTLILMSARWIQTYVGLPTRFVQTRLVHIHVHVDQGIPCQTLELVMVSIMGLILVVCQLIYPLLSTGSIQEMNKSLVCTGRAGLQINGGPGSLSHNFKIWPILFKGNWLSGPILVSCEKISL